MKVSSKAILEQIPIERIYKYQSEKENVSNKQNGGVRVGSNTAIRKAKKDAIKVLTKKNSIVKTIDAGF